MTQEEKAKAYDVLCDIANKNVLIFNEISDGWVKCLCSVHLDDNCCLNCTELYGREEQCSFAPATKEQRDLLFKKMHEAGYEWDAEHKQLNKIEQKSATMSLDEAIEHCREKSCGNNACALEHKQLEKWLIELKELKERKPAEWSKEDEVRINRIVACLENLNVADNDILLKDVDWLKSLKERIQPKVKWSEEDEKKRTLLISILEVNHPNGYFKVNPANTLNMEVMHTEELVDWLKSLRPQNRWKPSDEQMKALLSEVEAWTKGCPKQVILESLYNDLKKLKG